MNDATSLYVHIVYICIRKNGRSLGGYLKSYKNMVVDFYVFFMCRLYRFQFARFLKKHNINLIVSFVVSTSSKITSIFYDFFHAPLRISTISSDDRCQQHLATPPLVLFLVEGSNLFPRKMPGENFNHIQWHQHLATPPLLLFLVEGSSLFQRKMPGWEDFFDCTIKSPSGSSWHL